MQPANSATVYRSFVRAVRFFYGNGPRLIGLSLVWFLASLPIITLGPATLGAYAAIVSFQEHGEFDFSEVTATLKRHGLSATLLTGVVALLSVAAIKYAQLYLAAPTTLLLVLAVVTTYAAIYLQILLIPTFVGLATGDSVTRSLPRAVKWTASNAMGATTMVMATVFITIVTGVLTIAFVLVFAGLTFAFHIDVLTDDDILQYNTTIPDKA